MHSAVPETAKSYETQRLVVLENNRISHNPYTRVKYERWLVDRLRRMRRLGRGAATSKIRSLMS